MVSAGGPGKSIKCSACGGPIPVRTFKAGAVVCPNCGAQKDLSEDVTARMRALQVSLNARPSATAPAFNRKDVARGASTALGIYVGLAVLLLLIGVVAFLNI